MGVNFVKGAALNKETSEPTVVFEGVNKDQGTGKATVTQGGQETLVQVGRRALLIQGDNMCDLDGKSRGQVQDAIAAMDKKNLATIVGSLQVPKGTNNECTLKAGDLDKGVGGRQ